MTLCDANEWPSHDIHEIAALFDLILSSILDRLIPLKSVTLPRRASDPWYDNECRTA